MTTPEYIPDIDLQFGGDDVLPLDTDIMDGAGTAAGDDPFADATPANDIIDDALTTDTSMHDDACAMSANHIVDNGVAEAGHIAESESFITNTLSAPDQSQKVWGNVEAEQQPDDSDAVLRDFCQRVVDQYAEAKGLQHVPVVIDRNAGDAQANSGSPFRIGDEVIQINPDWVRDQILGGKINSPDAIAGALLHEYGHACRQDSGYTDDASKNFRVELQADEFAAHAMEQMGYDKEKFADLLGSFGSDMTTSTHPPGTLRAAIMRNG